jgi:hypothetical protein
VAVAATPLRCTQHQQQCHAVSEVESGKPLRRSESLPQLAAKPVPGTKAAIQAERDIYVTTRDDFGDALPHILGGRLLVNGAAATLEIRADGARQGMISFRPPINIDAPLQATIIGHNGYSPSPGFQAFKGDMSEIVAVKGTLTDGELASLETYLKTKYRLR